MRVSASSAEAEIRGEVMPLVFALASFGILAVTALDMIALVFLVGG